MDDEEVFSSDEEQGSSPSGYQASFNTIPQVENPQGSALPSRETDMATPSDASTSPSDSREDVHTPDVPDTSRSSTGPAK